MYVQCMKEYEVIRIAHPLKQADRALHTVIGVQTVGRNDQPVIAARHAVVDADAFSQEIRRRITAFLHPLRERETVGAQLDRDTAIKETAMMRIHARLDGRERRVGVLCHREMIVKDQPFAEKIMRVRHFLFEPFAHDRPRERIHEDVQYEAPARRIVSDPNGRADDIVLVGGDGGAFGEAEEIQRARVQPCRIVDHARFEADLLIVRRADDGQNDLRALRVDLRFAARGRGAHDVEREVAARMRRRAGRAPHGIDQP